jgi:hypothetical protein
MKIVLLVYLIIAVAIYLNLLIADYFYLAVRPGINSKDRVKVDAKVKMITSLRKLSIFWPYVLYRILK